MSLAVATKAALSIVAGNILIFLRKKEIFLFREFLARENSHNYKIPTRFLRCDFRFINYDIIVFRQLFS